MSDWLSKNAWALAIATATLISTYSLYGYQITQLEERVTKNSERIEEAQEGNVQVQVTLTKIQADLEYIKLRLDRNAVSY